MRTLERCTLFHPPYEIAVAQWSYADVFACTDSREKRGLLLFDIVDHSEEDGKPLKHFLETLLKQGWGFEENAQLALQTLREKLHPSNKSTWTEGSAIYLQLTPEHINVCNAGIPYPRHFNRQGLSTYPLHGAPFWEERPFDAQPYDITLEPEDALFICSDGIESNFRIHTNTDTIYLEEQLAALKCTSARKMLDVLLKNLGSIVQPQHPGDDDSSIIIITKSKF